MKSSITVGTGAAVEQAMNRNISLPLAGGIQEQTHLWVWAWQSEPCPCVVGWESESTVLVAPEESLHKLQMEKLRSCIIVQGVLCPSSMFLGFLNKNLGQWKKGLGGL